LAAQAKNNLQISQTQLKDYTIKSEIEGRVYAIYQEVGEMVSPTIQLGVIGDNSDFNIELQLDEYDIIKIEARQEVIVRLDSYDNEVFQARIDKINPIMNTKTRTFTVDATFIKKPEILYPNLSVEANIILHKKSQVLTIPVSYLSNEKFVVLKDGTRKEVSIGLRDYQKAEILSGLDKDSEIILQ
ncbi:MAG: efflux RND transporter periplasmic adaptor subunit, partial [Saprospiraceae bacterium]